MSGVESGDGVRVRMAHTEAWLKRVRYRWSLNRTSLNMNKRNRIPPLTWIFIDIGGCGEPCELFGNLPPLEPINDERNIILQ